MTNTEKWLKQYNDKKDELDEIRNVIVEEINKIFKNESVIVTSRIKDIDSLEEKIIRNKYLNIYQDKDNIFEFLKDGIGIRIICLEQKDEETIYQTLRKMHKDGKFNKFKFDESIKMQPELQKNGHSIYRLNAKRKDIIFEIQIKATTHMLWGEIEHLLFYKNYKNYIGADFLKEQIEQIYSDLLSVNNRLTNLKEYMSVNSLNANKELIEVTTKILHNKVNAQILLEYDGVQLDFRDLYRGIIQEYYYQIITYKNVTKKKKKKSSINQTIEQSDLIKALNSINMLKIEELDQFKLNCDFKKYKLNPNETKIIEALLNKVESDINKDEWKLFIIITSRMLDLEFEKMIVELAKRLNRKFNITLDNELELNLVTKETEIFNAILGYFSKYGDFLMLDNLFLDKIESSITKCISKLQNIVLEDESKSKVSLGLLVETLINFEYKKELHKDLFKRVLDEFQLNDSIKLKQSKITYSKEEFVDILEGGV